MGVASCAIPATSPPSPSTAWVEPARISGPVIAETAGGTAEKVLDTLLESPLGSGAHPILIDVPRGRLEQWLTAARLHLLAETDADAVGVGLSEP